MPRLQTSHRPGSTTRRARQPRRARRHCWPAPLAASRHLPSWAGADQPSHTHRESTRAGERGWADRSSCARPRRHNGEPAPWRRLRAARPYERRSCTGTPPHLRVGVNPRSGRRPAGPWRREGLHSVGFQSATRFRLHQSACGRPLSRLRSPRCHSPTPRFAQGEISATPSPDQMMIHRNAHQLRRKNSRPTT